MQSDHLGPRPARCGLYTSAAGTRRGAPGRARGPNRSQSPTRVQTCTTCVSRRATSGEDGSPGPSGGVSAVGRLLVVTREGGSGRALVRASSGGTERDGSRVRARGSLL